MNAPTLVEQIEAVERAEELFVALCNMGAEVDDLRRGLKAAAQTLRTSKAWELRQLEMDQFARDTLK